jgi:hypothetical protein
VLFISGLIEAFVTPSGLPTSMRVGIGVLALLGFLGYVFMAGAHGARRGASSDLDTVDRDADVPVA